MRMAELLRQEMIVTDHAEPRFPPSPPGPPLISGGRGEPEDAS